MNVRLILVCALLAIFTPTAVFADEIGTDNAASEATEVITTEEAKQPEAADDPSVTGEETPVEPDSIDMIPSGGEVTSPEATPEKEVALDQPTKSKAENDTQCGDTAAIEAAVERIRQTDGAEEVVLSDLRISSTMEDSLMDAITSAGIIGVEAEAYGLVTEGGIIQAFWIMYEHEDEDSEKVLLPEKEASTDAQPCEEAAVEESAGTPPQEKEVHISDNGRPAAAGIDGKETPGEMPEPTIPPLPLGKLAILLAAIREMLMKGGAAI